MAKKTPADVCREECQGKCCRYINLRIDPPRRKIDQEEIRWFLCHHGVRVSFEEGHWWLQVQTRCKHLKQDNLCAVYDTRPDVCRDYGTEGCDHTGDAFDHPVFETDDQWEAYMAAKKQRRNQRRRAASTRSAESGTPRKAEREPGT